MRNHRQTRLARAIEDAAGGCLELNIFHPTYCQYVRHNDLRCARTVRPRHVLLWPEWSRMQLCTQKRSIHSTRDVSTSAGSINHQGSKLRANDANSVRMRIRPAKPNMAKSATLDGTPDPARIVIGLTKQYHSEPKPATRSATTRLLYNAHATYTRPSDWRCWLHGNRFVEHGFQKSSINAFPLCNTA